MKPDQYFLFALMPRRHTLFCTGRKGERPAKGKSFDRFPFEPHPKRPKASPLGSGKLSVRQVFWVAFPVSLIPSDHRLCLWKPFILRKPGTSPDASVLVKRFNSLKISTNKNKPDQYFLFCAYAPWGRVSIAFPVTPILDGKALASSPARCPAVFSLDIVKIKNALYN